MIRSRAHSGSCEKYNPLTSSAHPLSSTTTGVSVDNANSSWRYPGLTIFQQLAKHKAIQFVVSEAGKKRFTDEMIAMQLSNSSWRYSLMAFDRCFPSRLSYTPSSSRVKYMAGIAYYEGMTETEIREFFRRLNNGKPLSAIELTRANVPGLTIFQQLY